MARAASETWCHRWGQELRQPTTLRKLARGTGDLWFLTFPWFIDVGSKCYLDAIFQCLLHCAAQKEHSLQLHPDDNLISEFNHIAKQYVRGPNLEHWPETAKFEGIALDALEESNHTLFYGWQHDTAELFAL